jgi:hypothetical protein
MAVAVLALVVAVAGVAVGAWGVVMSKDALTWQKERDRARLTPAVRIEFEHEGEPRGGPLYAPADLQDKRPWPLSYVLRISVVNQGETTEHVKRLRIEAADQSEGVDLALGGDDQELRPRARLARTVDLEDVPRWGSGFIVIVSLAGGEEVKSERERADQDLLDRIEKNNRNARP